MTQIRTIERDSPSDTPSLPLHMQWNLVGQHDYGGHGTTAVSMEVAGYGRASHGAGQRMSDTCLRSRGNHTLMHAHMHSSPLVHVERNLVGSFPRLDVRRDLRFHKVPHLCAPCSVVVVVVRRLVALVVPAWQQTRVTSVAIKRACWEATR